MNILKATIPTLFLLLFAVCANGQESGLRTRLVDENHSWRNKSADELEVLYFDLQPISTTTYRFHIRISMTGQTVDIHSSDHVSYFGMLTNYSVEVKGDGVDKNDGERIGTYQYWIEHIPLADTAVHEFVGGLLKSGQIGIPTDSSIASWKRDYWDCNSLVFQFNMDGTYTKQDFHCPWGQEDGMAFKHIILNNYESLLSSFQLDARYADFLDKLPKGGTYSRDGFRWMHKIRD